MSPKEVIKDVKSITAELISSGLAIDQNLPSSRNVHGVDVIGFAGGQDLSITLKSVEYETAYDALRQARSYNILLIDGGMIHLLYQFAGNLLIKHRLAFFPSPHLIEYQNNNEVYDDDERYGDIIYKGTVTVPIRFDYDPTNYVDIHHPKSHCTLGQYKNCRIPVSGPLTPGEFCSFILRSFYNTQFTKFLDGYIPAKPAFGVCISPSEKGIIYLGAHG